MPEFTHLQAIAIMDTKSLVKGTSTFGLGKVKYGAPHLVKGPQRRHLLVANYTTRLGVTLYVNKTSCDAVTFSQANLDPTGLEIILEEQYSKGSTGSAGNKGITTATAKCASLDPAYNDVLRLSVTTERAFRSILTWYSSVAALGSAD